MDSSEKLSDSEGLQSSHTMNQPYVEAYEA